jgi:hypothetical protein
MDLLFPILFNLILNPVLSLEEAEGGLCFGSQKLKLLTFASDLVLVAGSTNEAQIMLDLPEQGLEK